MWEKKRLGNLSIGYCNCTHEQSIKFIPVRIQKMLSRREHITFDSNHAAKRPKHFIAASINKEQDQCSTFHLRKFPEKIQLVIRLPKTEALHLKRKRNKKFRQKTKNLGQSPA